MTKVCSKCRIEKDTKDFPFQNRAKEKLHGECKLCHVQRNKESYAKNIKDNPAGHLRRLEKQTATRQRHKDYIKVLKNNPCVDCGIIYPSCAMDFDHIIGKKAFNVSFRGHLLSKESIDKEVAKCVLRCANCHRIKTHGCNSSNS